MATHDKSSTLIWTQSSPGACWSCGDMRATHFCTSCGKLQPATPADYFTFFGLPRKLNIDLAALEQEFYALSRKLHPDIVSRATAQEQQWSLQKSSQLNDAYRTLRDPILRTQYLLKLEGVELEEQSKTATETARASGQEKKQVVPPDLLEEVFELNLQLEELRMNKTMGEQDEQLVRDLEQHKESLENKLAALDAELRGYWNDWDAAADRAASEPERTRVRDRMVDLLNRRSYVRNLVREVSETLES